MVIGSREMLLILGAIGYYAFDVASMGAAFEALGGGGPALGLFVLAYTIGHAGAIIPLPGSAEGGLVGAFTLFGAPLSLAVGGILLYRVFHAGVPFLLGALGLADMGRHRHEDVLDDAVEEAPEVLEEAAAEAPAPHRRRQARPHRARGPRNLPTSARPSAPRTDARRPGRRSVLDQGADGGERSASAASARGRGSVSQASIAVAAKAKPTQQTGSQPPALQAIDPAAEPIAPPVKLEVT